MNEKPTSANDIAKVELNDLIMQSDIPQTGHEEAKSLTGGRDNDLEQALITDRHSGTVVSRDASAAVIKAYTKKRDQRAALRYREYSDGTAESEAEIKTPEGNYKTITSRGGQDTHTYVEKDGEVIALDNPRTAVLVTELAAAAVRRVQEDAPKDEAEQLRIAREEQAILDRATLVRSFTTKKGVVRQRALARYIKRLENSPYNVQDLS